MNNNNTQTRPSAEQQAYDLVKERILSLTLKPGQYITDNEIASELNISRTPIREALRRLEHEGLLTNQPRRGWQVCILSLADIHEIFDIKEALEVMLARHAATCQDETLRNDLRKAMAGLQQASETGDQQAWMEAHTQWHQTVFAMIASPRNRAAQIIQMLNDQWWRLYFLTIAVEGRLERKTREHAFVAEAILAGDSERAEQLMRHHLKNTRQDLVHLLANVVLPFVSEGV
jgi:DNA-binding GntR family transcriptional regulator